MAGAGAAHAAAVNAIKASGVFVRVEIAEFMAIVARASDPLVVVSYGGTFRKSYRYLTSYKGLAFFAKTPDQIIFPRNIEIVSAKSLFVPNM